VFNIAAEKTFENKIKKFLDDRGAWFVKYWAGAQYTKSGIPDILACVNGYFVGIEVKAPNGKPSEIQLYNVRRINAAGGFAFVLYPSKFDEFKRFVEGLQREEFDRDNIPEIWK
jgi:Holliday junction resolvase